VAQGTPEEIAEVPASHTGRYLQPLLAPTQAVLAG
jgi:excinuclease ABC subunit A